MKKILLIAFIAMLTTITANAQTQLHDYDIDELRSSWQKTITVPVSQASVVEKLFLAWSKEFPNVFTEVFDKFKKTGKTTDIKINDCDYKFKLDFAPKNGFLSIDGDYSYICEVDGNYKKGDKITKEQILNAVYWNLTNGNKLFGVSFQIPGECFNNCMVAFYEYNVAQGTLSPRADIAKNVMKAVGDDTEIFVSLPKEGRDIRYFDYSDQKTKVIKWNGNGF